MPRSGRMRNFIREYEESPRFEKLSFIPPFLIVFVEGVLLAHALTIKAPDLMVVELTLILLIISIIEIFFVIGEIHRHYAQNNFNKILVIKLDDFIIEKKERNVKKIVTDFIDYYPEYKNNRDEIYHTTCQIMQTHKEEAWAKELDKKLKSFLKRRKKKNVDVILKAFLKKYPKYRNFRIQIYDKTCKMLGESYKKS